MKIDKRTLQRIALMEAAKDITRTPMDKTPMLIGDRCMADGQEIVRDAAIAAYSSGRPVASETLTMPRTGFGPRPINTIATQGRAVYAALAERIRPLLPPESRTDETWTAFNSAGLEGREDTYIVELDIASCYEYIDHVQLHEELLLQTMDVEVSDAIVAFLGDVFGRSRGLPQLLGASDLLSDAYLQGIERELVRKGYDVIRYADDFKVTAQNWGEATEIIENAADIARRFGLVLSSAKTNVRKSRTVREQRDSEAAFINDYFNSARENLTQIDIFRVGYDDFDEIETLPSEQDAFEEASWRIFAEWAEARTKQEPQEQLPFHAQFIPAGLSILRTATTRIQDSTLEQIVFATPIRLRSVLNYITARSEHEENWVSLATLVAMERQSPWAKLWLLSAAGRLQKSDDSASDRFTSWARKQLEERHEVVRAEAAWYLANSGSLLDTDLRHLSALASDISRPALAAAAAAATMTGKFAQSLKSESPLNKHAYSWGESKAN